MKEKKKGTPHNLLCQVQRVEQKLWDINACAVLEQEQLHLK
jgi:hypothetical protein